MTSQRGIYLITPEHPNSPTLDKRKEDDATLETNFQMVKITSPAEGSAIKESF